MFLFLANKNPGTEGRAVSDYTGSLNVLDVRPLEVGTQP